MLPEREKREDIDICWGLAAREFGYTIEDGWRLGRLGRFERFEDLKDLRGLRDLKI
jgi:hypothetical protein